MNEDRMTKEEYLAGRKAAGRLIDVETCRIFMARCPIGDPWGRASIRITPTLRSISSSHPPQAMARCGRSICRKTSAAHWTPGATASNAELNNTRNGSLLNPARLFADRLKAWPSNPGGGRSKKRGMTARATASSHAHSRTYSNSPKVPETGLKTARQKPGKDRGQPCAFLN
jgi:hypothetical protein